MVLPLEGCFAPFGLLIQTGKITLGTMRHLHTHMPVINNQHDHLNRNHIKSASSRNQKCCPFAYQRSLGKPILLPTKFKLLVVAPNCSSHHRTCVPHSLPRLGTGKIWYGCPYTVFCSFVFMTTSTETNRSYFLLETHSLYCPSLTKMGRNHCYTSNW